MSSRIGLPRIFSASTYVTVLSRALSVLRFPESPRSPPGSIGFSHFFPRSSFTRSLNLNPLCIIGLYSPFVSSRNFLGITLPFSIHITNVSPSTLVFGFIKPSRDLVQLPLIASSNLSLSRSLQPLSSRFMSPWAEVCLPVLALSPFIIGVTFPLHNGPVLPGTPLLQFSPF